MAKKPFLVFNSQRELIYFLTLLDKFLALKLGRMTHFLEPVRNCGQEGYALSWEEEGDARSVQFSSITSRTSKKLPDFRSEIRLHLNTHDGREIEIRGCADFLHSQKLSCRFEVFLNKEGNSEVNSNFEQLLGRIQGFVFERMEEYPDAQAFAEGNYPALKEWMDSEEHIPF